MPRPFLAAGLSGKSVFGTLTFTRRDGAVLELADALCADGSRSELHIIVGQTAGGKYVTLLHANQISAPLFRLTKTFPCMYHATGLIVGAAFDSEAEMRFWLWQIRIPELNAWVGTHGFNVDTSDLIAGNHRLAVRINYQAPETQVLLGSDTGLYLALSFWPLLRPGLSARTLRQDVCIEVRLGSGNDKLDDYMQVSTRFEHFLTLATGALVRIGAIKAVVRAADPSPTGTPVIVDILYQPVRNAPRRDSRKDEFCLHCRT